ncbi:MAG: hypothetical protein ACRC0X_00760 [Brevinema sp.]
MTLLHLAAIYKRVKTVPLLCQQGANVHAKDKGYRQQCVSNPQCSHLQLALISVLAGFHEFEDFKKSSKIEQIHNK